MTAVLRPETEEELAQAVARAAGPLVVRGGGTRGGAGPVAGTLLETGGLSGIVLHEPGALTLVAKAGTPVAEIEAALAAEGQRLAFEVPDRRGLLGTLGQSTIGGVVATNASGPRRVQAGACRDALLGVRFVDGTGTVVKNGGRVMKNVTGYDLAKLMAGSRGTLGVLTEVAFKVLPVPEAVATVAVAVEGAGAAVAALSAALGSPFDITGAAYLPGRGALVRIEGFAASVAYRAARLADLLGRHGAVTVERDPSRVAADWAEVRDVAPFHGQAGDVWRIALKPSDAPEAVARLGAPHVLDWGGGLLWALLPEGTEARALLAGTGGHATLIRAAPATRARIAALPPEAPAIAALAEGLRVRFDPRGILNPGRAA
jgi:glycolate oxidase FAD binding subunit